MIKTRSEWVAFERRVILKKQHNPVKKKERLRERRLINGALHRPSTEKSSFWLVLIFVTTNVTKHEASQALLVICGGLVIRNFVGGQ